MNRFTRSLLSILLSVLISIVASGVGLWLAFHLRHNHKGAVVNRIVAALVMGASVCAMHYTGMAAASFQPAHHVMPGGVSEMGLSVWVSATTLILLGIMLVISLVDSHARAQRLTDNLRQLNNQLEIQARFDALTGLAVRLSCRRIRWFARAAVPKVMYGVKTVFSGRWRCSLPPSCSTFLPIFCRS
jgi:hypothetical protein